MFRLTHSRAGSDLPPRFIPDSEYSDCITFGDVFLAISQLGKAQGIARRVSLITGYVDSLLNHYICPINSGVFDHDIWWHADYVGQSYTLIISGLRSERTAVKESLRRPRRDGPVSGLGLLRKRGTLPSPSPVSKTTFSVLERRTMFCVHLFPDLARHRLFYSLVTSTWEPHAVLNLRAREVASVYKPLYIYLWFVRIELNAIQKDWTEVLDLLDGELNVTVCPATVLNTVVVMDADVNS